jgi:chemotaxis protein MotA
MSKRRIDRSTAVGVLLAMAGVATGLMLDGGSLKQILQPSAALIVIAGTLGAVLIQFPMQMLVETLRLLPCVVMERGPLCAAVLEELVSYSVQARRHGIVKLDDRLNEIQDSFLRKAMMLAIDGAQIGAMRQSMELELDLADEREHGAVKVLEAAGGFAPTLGIIGAVLGLIQVMQRMDNVGEIGKGIAVAFVSTLYGLGLANLLLLPLAGKLRIRLRERQLVREMMLEAVVSIMEGVTPRALKERLECYIAEHTAAARAVQQPELVAR